MIMFFLFGCQEYSLFGKSAESAPNEPGGSSVSEDTSVEEDIIVEDDTSTPTDSGVETTVPQDEPISFDDTEDAEYCTRFDDFEDWSYLGEGNWRIENGMLVENRNGPYATIAYLYDFGVHSRFSIETGTAFASNMNDYAGLVFNLDPNTESYWIARWDDPQGDYNRYQPTGRMELVRCENSACTVLASDDTHDLQFASDGNFAQWQVRVEGEYVEIHWQGQVVFAQTVEGIYGPGLVGLYSNDNDGGIFYDDMCVWVDE